MNITSNQREPNGDDVPMDFVARLLLATDSPKPRLPIPLASELIHLVDPTMMPRQVEFVESLMGDLLGRQVDLPDRLNEVVSLNAMADFLNPEKARIVVDSVMRPRYVGIARKRPLLAMMKPRNCQLALPLRIKSVGP